MVLKTVAEAARGAEQAVGEADVALGHVQAGGAVAHDEDPGEGDVGEGLEDQPPDDAARGDEGQEAAGQGLDGVGHRQL
jgi:hypothetical protein